MLKDILASGEMVRVIDYLLDEPGAVLNKSEIAEGAEISRPTLYSLWDRLEALRIVSVAGREEGVEKYRLNTGSKLVMSLLRFDAELSNVMAVVGISTPEPAPQAIAVVNNRPSSAECHVQEVVRSYLPGRGPYGLSGPVAILAASERSGKRPFAELVLNPA